MSSEARAMELQRYVSEFEERWKAAKLSVKAKIKKGVFDATIDDDIRVERCVEYKPAKRELIALRRVCLFKQEILANTKEQVAEYRLEFMCGVEFEKPGPFGTVKRTAEDLGAFLEALRELEDSGMVKVIREPGYANETTKKAVFDFQGRSSDYEFTGPTPSHGFTKSYCQDCEVVRSDM